MNSGLELQHGSWTRDKFLSASDTADRLTGQRRMSQVLSKHFLEAFIATALGSVVGVSYGVLAEDGDQILNAAKTFLIAGGTAIISYTTARLFTYYFSVHANRAEIAVDYLGRRTERN